MAIYTGPYVGAKSCTSGPQPGAWGAMDYFLAAYKSKGGVNTGIYNCRTVRGGRTTSLHGEGRAADFGIRPYGAKYGTALANALVAYSKELGIQCVIWNRKIWSSSYPHSGWRRYRGVASHTDHIHVEFTWARARAGRKETAQHFAKVLGGVKPGDVKTGGGGKKYREVKYGDMLRLYTKGAPVKEWQQKALGYKGKKADGYFGPDTERDTKALQRRFGVTADGIVGPTTWPLRNKVNAKPVAKKTTTTAPAFPLKKGYYFGPKSGPNRSVSGYYHSREHLRRWQKQMKKRGWRIDTDGLYGTQTQRVARAFQKEKGLSRDGLIGASTWAAAWESPVT